jgi:regulator of PEP synthase PpsR (kinase-PPPase family)
MPPQTHRVLLYPTEEAALERNLKRSGVSEFSQYISGGIRAVYGFLQAAVDGLMKQGWIVVDTTNKSVDETVTEILARTGVQ